MVLTPARPGQFTDTRRHRTAAGYRPRNLGDASVPLKEEEMRLLFGSKNKKSTTAGYRDLDFENLPKAWDLVEPFAKKTQIFRNDTQPGQKQCA